MQRKRCCF